MERMLAPRQLPHFLALLKDRQADRALVLAPRLLSRRRRRLLLVLEARQEIPVRVLKAPARLRDLDEPLGPPAGPVAVSAPLDDDEVVQGEDDGGGPHND